MLSYFGIQVLKNGFVWKLKYGYILSSIFDFFHSCWLFYIFEYNKMHLFGLTFLLYFLGSFVTQKTNKNLSYSSE